MKKIVFSFLFLALFLTALSAQENPSITLVNETGRTVWYVYLSSTADNSWGSDRLDPDQTFGNGDSVSLRLPHALNVVNRYDIRLIDSDRVAYVKRDILVTANIRIVFNQNDCTTITGNNTGFNGPSITIVNSTGNTIWYVRLSSTADTSWGSDRLNSDQELGSGDSVSLRLPHPLNVVNRYDIMLEDPDGKTFTKMDVLLSENGRVRFTSDDAD